MQLKKLFVSSIKKSNEPKKSQRCKHCDKEKKLHLAYYDVLYNKTFFYCIREKGIIRVKTYVRKKKMYVKRLEYSPCDE